MINKSRVYWFLEISSYKYNYRYTWRNMKQIMKVNMIEKVKEEEEEEREELSGCGRPTRPVVWFRVCECIDNSTVLKLIILKRE